MELLLHGMVWYGAMLIAVTVHEFAHLAAASALSMRVEKVSVGAEPLLLSRRGARTTFALRLLPFVGWVRLSARAVTTRTGLLAFLLAGVAANAAFIGLVNAADAVFHLPRDLDWLFGPVVFAQVTAIVCSLIPWRLHGMPSDGLQAFHLLRRRRAVVGRQDARAREPKG